MKITTVRVKEETANKLLILKKKLKCKSIEQVILSGIRKLEATQLTELFMEASEPKIFYGGKKISPVAESGCKTFIGA